MVIETGGEFTKDDFIMIKEGTTQEILKVTAKANATNYTVQRGVSGTASAWQKGAAVVSFGQTTSQGFIMMDAIDSDGPFIDIIQRTGATNWNDYAMKIRLGNLDGVSDINTTFGVTPGAGENYGAYLDNAFIKGNLYLAPGKDILLDPQVSGPAEIKWRDVDTSTDYFSIKATDGGGGVVRLSIDPETANRRLTIGSSSQDWDDVTVNTDGMTINTDGEFTINAGTSGKTLKTGDAYGQKFTTSTLYAYTTNQLIWEDSTAGVSTQAKSYVKLTKASIDIVTELQNIAGGVIADINLTSYGDTNLTAGVASTRLSDITIKAFGTATLQSSVNAINVNVTSTEASINFDSDTSVVVDTNGVQIDGGSGSSSVYFAVTSSMCRMQADGGAQRVDVTGTTVSMYAQGGDEAIHIDNLGIEVWINAINRGPAQWVLGSSVAASGLYFLGF